MTLIRLSNRDCSLTMKTLMSILPKLCVSFCSHVFRLCWNAPSEDVLSDRIEDPSDRIQVSSAGSHDQNEH